MRAGTEHIFDYFIMLKICSLQAKINRLYSNLCFFKKNVPLTFIYSFYHAQKHIQLFRVLYTKRDPKPFKMQITYNPPSARSHTILGLFVSYLICIRYHLATLYNVVTVLPKITEKRLKHEFVTAQSIPTVLSFCNMQITCEVGPQHTTP